MAFKSTSLLCTTETLHLAAADSVPNVMMKRMESVRAAMFSETVRIAR